MKRFYFVLARTVEQLSTVEVDCYTEEEARAVLQATLDHGTNDWAPIEDDPKIEVCDMTSEEL